MDMESKWRMDSVADCTIHALNTVGHPSNFGSCSLPFWSGEAVSAFKPSKGQCSNLKNQVTFGINCSACKGLHNWLLSWNDQRFFPCNIGLCDHSM